MGNSFYWAYIIAPSTLPPKKRLFYFIFLALTPVLRTNPRRDLPVSGLALTPIVTAGFSPTFRATVICTVQTGEEKERKLQNFVNELNLIVFVGKKSR